MPVFTRDGRDGLADFLCNYSATELRFRLPTLHERHFTQPGEITRIKDPDAFRHIMLMRQLRFDPLPSGTFLASPP